jgi:hypothetical protein
MTTPPNNQQLPLDGQLDRAMDPEYAAISTMAVLGLASSLVGALAFMLPPLIVLPAMGLVMGVLALRKIRRSEGILAGRSIALAACMVGALVLAGSTAYHLHNWLSERQVLNDLTNRSYAITDDILAGRYDRVYNAMPEEFRQEGRGAEDFRAHIAPALAGAGSVVRRVLLSLEVVRLEDGTVVAPAKVHVELERRYLEFKMVFKKSPAGTWDLAGVGVGETFESQAKFAPEEPEVTPPPENPAPAAKP